MEWISVKDELPQDGEIVFAYRPMARFSGDPIYTHQKFISIDYKNRSKQGIVHGFNRWHHPTHWMRIEPPKT